MRRVDEGARSSVWEDTDGTAFRVFHDTGHVVTLEWSADERGTRRFCHNRTKNGMLRHMRGGTAARCPKHLLRAKECVMTCDTIDEIATQCRVKRSTAWSYTTQVCQTSREARDHVRASHIVCASLWEAVDGAPCLSGCLKDVMERLKESSSLDGCPHWRCESDRYAQLRLARICATADSDDSAGPGDSHSL